MIWVWTVIVTCFDQLLADKQPAKESSDHEEQEGSSDSDYSSSQMDSSDSSVMIEMESASTNLSLPEASENNRPTPNSLSEDLDSKLLLW